MKVEVSLQLTARCKKNQTKTALEFSHHDGKSKELILHPPEGSDGNTAVTAKVDIAHVHSSAS